jgi:hypothetical protein
MKIERMIIRATNPNGMDDQEYEIKLNKKIKNVILCGAFSIDIETDEFLITTNPFNNWTAIRKSEVEVLFDDEPSEGDKENE